MDGRTGGAVGDARLRELIECLEECQRFYLDAVNGSVGSPRSRYAHKAEGYAAMLAAIRQWSLYSTRSRCGQRASSALRSGGRDGYGTLLQRLDRMHQRLLEPQDELPGATVTAGLGDLRPRAHAGQLVTTVQRVPRGSR